MIEPTYIPFIFQMCNNFSQRRQIFLFQHPHKMKDIGLSFVLHGGYVVHFDCEVFQC